jgi:hypothetical protein
METEDLFLEGDDSADMKIRKQRGKMDLAVAELGKKINGQASPVKVSFVCPICQGPHSKKDHA